MKANTRMSIAYVAGCLINKKDFSSLADHSEGKTVNMTGRCNYSNIDVQMEDDNKIIGSIKGSEVSFFHTAEKRAIRMKTEGTNFKGNDAATGKDFTGSVSGKGVKIYDYDCYQNFFFTLND